MFRISTENGKKPHYHLLYGSNDGVECAEADGHSHIVEIKRETVDPQTLEVVQLPNPVAVFLESDGHVHEVGGEVQLEETSTGNDSDDDKVAKARKLFLSAKECEREPREKARESVAFYEGDQWEERHKSALNAKGRVVLTVNHIENAVDTLSGYFRQNRTDFRFFGVENSDNRIADIVTEVVRNICERNEYAHVETCVFEDEVVPGRGLFHSYVDFEDNVEGDVRIERYEWDDVYFGPHNKADASDAEHMHKSKWFSKDKLKNEYPDLADDIQADFDQYADDDKADTVSPGREYEKAFSDTDGHKLVPNFVDPKQKTYRVVETEQKLYVRIPVLTRIDDDDPVNAAGWSKKDLTAAKSLGFSVIRRPSHKIKVTKIAGGVLLDEYTLDEKYFSITPVYAKKRKDNWYGKVESAKDPQRELNKLRSQQVDIVNNMTVSGWFIEEGTFTSTKDSRKFEQNATSAGGQFKVNQGRRPERIESSPLPSGLLNAMETARSEIKQVLSVRTEAAEGKSNSGLAIIQGQKIAMLGNEYLYDNMAQSKKRLGKRIVSLIQQTHTPERIMRILGSAASRRQVTVGDQEYDPNNEAMKQELTQMLENQDLTKLDIVVGETSHSPNKQMADFVMNLEIARVTGGGIPREILIESSPMSEDQKAKSLKAIQQSQQAAAKAEQQKQQTEVEKSLPDQLKLQKAMQGQAGPQRAGLPPMR